MNVHFSYKSPKSPEIEKEINQLITKLQKRLQVFRPELVHLHGIVEENAARTGTVVSLNLRLPSGQLAAQEMAPSPTAALKTAFNALRQQLTKHKDLLRNQYKWARRRRASRTGPQPQVPFEETLASVQAPTVSAADITTYINTSLPRLTRFVERELRYRESAGQIEPDQIVPEDVIGEAMTMALGDGIERPERLSLEPWLYRLSMRALDELIARASEGVSEVPLESSVRARNVRGSDEPQLQFHQPDESMTEETVIADRRIATPEESASSDELITLVEAALLSAKREDREAFLLFGVDGFSPEEISAISDRPVEQVKQSIRTAREHLRKALPVPDEFKDKLLQHTRIA
jgi:DNA-directed RNA polymerase specialized sigma24 family protein/ribosome-associated translation inhibitor RaiA